MEARITSTTTGWDPDTVHGDAWTAGLRTFGPGRAMEGLGSVEETMIVLPRWSDLSSEPVKWS